MTRAWRKAIPGAMPTTHGVDQGSVLGWALRHRCFPRVSRFGCSVPELVFKCKEQGWVFVFLGADQDAYSERG